MLLIVLSALGHQVECEAPFIMYANVCYRCADDEVLIASSNRPYCVLGTLCPDE